MCNHLSKIIFYQEFERYFKKSYSQSIWILPKAVSTGLEARQGCMRERSHRSPLPAAPSQLARPLRTLCSWAGAILQIIFKKKKKSAFWEIFPATQTSRRASTTTFQGQGGSSIQFTGPWKWLWHSRRGFFSALGCFEFWKSEAFPAGCGLLQRNHADDPEMWAWWVLLVRSTHSAPVSDFNEGREELNPCLICCLGNLKRGVISSITSRLKFIMMIEYCFHLKEKTEWLVCKSLPKLSIQEHPWGKENEGKTSL